MPHLEQELFTLPEHLRSPPVLSEVRVARSLVFCVAFCRSLFVFLAFFFGHCIVCPSSISLDIVLFVLLPFLWTLYCLSFFHFSGHCIVCPSSISLDIVLFVLPPFLWTLYCLSFFHFFGHCIVCPSSFGHCIVCPSISLDIVLFVLLPFIASGYFSGLFKLFIKFVVITIRSFHHKRVCCQ